MALREWALDSDDRNRSAPACHLHTLIDRYQPKAVIEKLIKPKLINYK